MDQYGKWNYIIASMKKTSVSGSDLTKEERASFTADEVSFAGIVFSLPGAWAQYSVTVTNKGSVDANLENAVIRLDTENEDQLSLDAPDLTGKTLSPGESCTIQVVVKALDNGTGSLNASGDWLLNCLMHRIRWSLLRTLPTQNKRNHINGRPVCVQA